MRILESTLEKRVCGLALQRGVIGLKLNVHGQTGWPDRLFLIPGGRPLFIEFKRPGGKGVLSPKQIHIHSILRAAGYQVEIHDNVIFALHDIEKALEASRRKK